MYHTTGLRRDEITDLCAMINERYPTSSKRRGRPRSLGLFKSVVVTLNYLRRNHVQQELGERYGASQPTISRVVARLTPMLADVLADWVPTVEDLDPATQLIIDGTLLPCWSWSGHRELWSGKHRTTGLNVQVACTIGGTLAWVSDPTPGSTHDSKSLRETGLLDTDPNHRPLHLGDKGYIGLGMLTPHRKPPGEDLPESRKDLNKQVNSIRATIERVIANLKTWRILHTDYRRPLDTFQQTITAVLGLEFYRSAL